MHYSCALKCLADESLRLVQNLCIMPCRMILAFRNTGSGYSGYRRAPRFAGLGRYDDRGHSLHNRDDGLFRRTPPFIHVCTQGHKRIQIIRQQKVPTTSCRMITAFRNNGSVFLDTGSRPALRDLAGMTVKAPSVFSGMTVFFAENSPAPRVCMHKFLSGLNNRPVAFFATRRLQSRGRGSFRRPPPG